LALPATKGAEHLRTLEQTGKSPGGSEYDMNAPRERRPALRRTRLSLLA
jgi:hypothetical protein